MSTYTDASLIYYPSGVKAGKAYSLKPTDGSGDLTFTRASSATRVNAAGLIESVATGVPRIDYTGGGCGKLLLEPQRSNLLLQSNNFNTTWTRADVTLTPNVTTSPDGTLNAFENIEGTGTSTKLILQSVTVSSGATIAEFFFVKKKNRKYIQIRENTNGSFFFFNFDTALAENITGACVPFIENYGNGWYKVGMITTVPSTSSQVRLYHSDNSKNIVYNGDGISGFYLWQSQIESGSYSTSLIPTTSTAVTRVADNASVTTPAGVTQITETFGNGSTNVITSIPATYTASLGNIQSIIMI